MEPAWLAQGSSVQSYVFWGALFLFAGVETLVPLRAACIPTTKRWLNHGVLFLLNIVLVAMIFRAGVVVFAFYLESRGWGLLPHLPIPAWVRFAVAFVSLDLAHFLSHVAYHRVGILWRIHRVHHNDLDFDVTTSLRFHPLEGIFTQAFIFGVVALLGPSALAVLTAVIASSVVDLFEHANVELPAKLDRMLRLILITPNMHRIHHATDVGFQNGNFGTIFPWWDRVFGTYVASPHGELKEMEVGLEGHGPERSASIVATLATPFTPIVQPRP